VTARANRLSARTRRALSRVQARLEGYYELESAPNVVDFTSTAAAGEREVLFVRDLGEHVEMMLRVPSAPPSGQASDAYLQLCEGVSHFLFLAERVRVGLPATQLELELQAEVDKFVLLALEPTEPDPRHARGLHQRLFNDVVYLYPAGTEAGERYRLANDLAARLALKVLDRAPSDARALLRRFYRAGQAEKIALARAA